MIINKWILTVIGVVIVFALTNPSKDDYVEWAKVKLVNISDNGLIPIVVGVAGNAVFRNTTERKDFLIFSVFRTNLGGSEIQVIGALGNLFEIRSLSHLSHDAIADKAGGVIASYTKQDSFSTKPTPMEREPPIQNRQSKLKEWERPKLSMEYSLVPGKPPIPSAIKGATQLSDVFVENNCNPDIAAGTIEQVQFGKLGRPDGFLLRTYNDNSILKIEIESSDKLSEAEASWLNQLISPKRNVIATYVRCGASGHYAYAQDVFDIRFIIPLPKGN